MNLSRLLRIVGFFLVSLGVVLIFIIIVLPYSRLLGKENLDLTVDRDFTSSEPDRRPPVLPIYSRLKGEAVKGGGIYLTIEKLGIHKVPITANVVVNNLKPDYLNAIANSLGHLSGTSLPGERGNSVIFGHSALPYLYSPRNFQTVFTRIDELKFGDVIELEVGGTILSYKVERGGLVDENATVSDFASGKPRLTLLTCYPPGFKSQKYAVRALLVN